ncbi:hypothetical protein OIU84_006950 [Salix udensis]|uniref:Endonuclease/exonuclease/phosphatase domain-containing protein n=1 Tax=Salix udensis TaxID=889485 RepID=A0AAD6P2E7_9ROSI|nr:hypothetical protein OIU84_006950 [Salix udensis]
MVDLDRIAFFTRTLGFSNSMANCANKIWIFWVEDLTVNLFKDHTQCLTVSINTPWLPKSFFISFVYAKNLRSERKILWDELCEVASLLDGPWVVGGDFNAVLNVNESKGGGNPNQGSMEEFGSCLLDCGLLDAGYEGNDFTWTNGKVMRRLDRIVFNPEWSDLFSLTRVKHLNRVGSDHCPLLLQCSQAVQSFSSSFRFLHMWTHHHDFLNVVKSNWDHPSGSTGCLNFWLKQQRLKSCLKWWNKYKFGNIFDKIKIAEDNVTKREIIFQNDPSSNNREALHKEMAILNKTLFLKRNFWQQKSGCKWLLEGDRNTRYYQTFYSKRRGLKISFGPFKMMMALFSMMLWRLKRSRRGLLFSLLLTKDNDINVDPYRQ